jgi:hypothetical protein
MRRLVILLPLLAAACSAPIGPLTRGQADRDPREEACRAEATRIVQYRERGQTMRTDENESSRGITTVAPFQRTESDRMRAQMDRDQIMRDCLGVSPNQGTPR